MALEHSASTVTPAAMRQLVLDLPPPPPSFSNFVVGRNADALAAIHALKPGHAVYLSGPEGAGKTHVLSAYLHSATQLPFAVHVIDDVHALSADGQHKAFVLFNRCVQEGQGALLMAGRVPAVALPVREDLRTRAGLALQFALQPLNDDEKQAALVQMAQRLGVKLQDQVPAYLLAHHSRDMRSLASTMQALNQLSLEHQRAITLPLLRQWLQQHR